MTNTVTLNTSNKRGKRERKRRKIKRNNKNKQKLMRKRKKEKQKQRKPWGEKKKKKKRKIKEKVRYFLTVGGQSISRVSTKQRCDSVAVYWNTALTSLVFLTWWSEKSEWAESRLLSSWLYCLRAKYTFFFLNSTKKWHILHVCGAYHLFFVSLSENPQTDQWGFKLFLSPKP